MKQNAIIQLGIIWSESNDRPDQLAAQIIELLSSDQYDFLIGEKEPTLFEKLFNAAIYYQDQPSPATAAKMGQLYQKLLAKAELAKR